MSGKRIFGLIGKPLGHSFSANYFGRKFLNENITDCEYKNFEIGSLEELAIVLDTPGLEGLNVTIPYKESVIPFLDELSAEAAEIGAVNTIRISSAGNKKYLSGSNTDAFGFSMSLKPFLLNLHERALVLGNGGASKAVCYVLRTLGIDYTLVTRNKTSSGFTYEELNKYIIGSHLLIVNTTPLGMHPMEDSCPEIPYEYLTGDHLLYDLVYNPEQTLFLKKGKKYGAVTLNGLSMLHLQAEKSWEIWNE